MTLHIITAENLESFLTGHDAVILTFMRQESPSYAALEPDLVSLAASYADVAFGTVDADEQQSIAASARIDAIPTIMAFREGNLVFREKGALEQQALVQLAEAVRELDLQAVLAERARAAAPGGTAEATVDDVHAALRTGSLVLDVRTPLEYAAGHIPGAVLLPLHELARSTDRLPADEPVLVVCKDGERSRQACQLLDGLGLRGVVVAGGMTAWTGSGAPVETGRPQ